MKDDPSDDAGRKECQERTAEQEHSLLKFRVEAEETMSDQKLSPLCKEATECNSNITDPGSPVADIPEDCATPARRKRVRIRKRRRIRKRSGGVETPSSSEPLSSTQRQQQQQQQLSKQQKQPQKKSHDAPMTKRDIYFCVRCGMIQVAVERALGGNIYLQNAQLAHYASTTTSQFLPVQDVVARVTMVNWDNQIVFDVFVRPQPLLPIAVPKGTKEADVAAFAALFRVKEVLDYRTAQTGVTPRHLERSKRTVSVAQIRQALKRQIKGKIIVGHMVQQHLAALGLTHPWCDTRDTAQYVPFMKSVTPPAADAASLPSPLQHHRHHQVHLEPTDLPTLLRQVLYWHTINGGLLGEAIGCLDLYKHVRKQWETELAVLAQQRAAGERLRQEKERQLERQMKFAAAAHQQRVHAPEYASDAAAAVARAAYGLPHYSTSSNYSPSHRSYGESSVATLSTQPLANFAAPVAVHRSSSTEAARRCNPTSGFALYDRLASSVLNLPSMVPRDGSNCHSHGSHSQQQLPLTSAHAHFSNDIRLKSHGSEANGSASSCTTSRPPSCSGYGSWSANRSFAQMQAVPPSIQRAWSDPSSILHSGEERSAPTSVSQVDYRGRVSDDRGIRVWIPSASIGESVDGDGWSSSESEASDQSIKEQNITLSDEPPVASGFNDRHRVDSSSNFGPEEDLRQHLPSTLFEDLGDDEPTPTACADAVRQLPRRQLATGEQEADIRISPLHHTSFSHSWEAMGEVDTPRSQRETQELGCPEQPWSPLLTQSFSLLALHQNPHQDSLSTAISRSAVRGPVAPPPGFDPGRFTPTTSATSRVDLKLPGVPPARPAAEAVIASALDCTSPTTSSWESCPIPGSSSPSKRQPALTTQPSRLSQEDFWTEGNSSKRGLDSSLW